MAKVEIYTKAFCPYCVRAKALLKSKGVAFEEFDITLGGPHRAEMIERAEGRMTVPQIFIDGVPVGGSDDLAALDRDGKLDALLRGMKIAVLQMTSGIDPAANAADDDRRQWPTQPRPAPRCCSPRKCRACSIATGHARRPAS